MKLAYVFFFSLFLSIKKYFQICVWGEFVNSFNSISVTWPRSSAPAEILWTGKADQLDLAARRLQEHECRMIGLGFQISPIVGAGFCEKDIFER